MDGERRTIRAIRRPRGEEVRVTLQWFRGRQYVDVRLFFPDHATGEMCPSRKGVVLPVDDLGGLLEALQDARAVSLGGNRHALEADPHARSQ